METTRKEPLSLNGLIQHTLNNINSLSNDDVNVYPNQLTFSVYLNPDGSINESQGTGFHTEFTLRILRKAKNYGLSDTIMQKYKLTEDKKIDVNTVEAILDNEKEPEIHG